MAVELKPRIVVIGVGGAGGNAVNNMIDANLQGVEFVVANTDAQALVRSKAPVQIQLGMGKTAGLGAGANPEVGAEAAKESSDEIKKLLHGAHMCFIAAGMGGGTGTGAAPIIARIAREQHVLTVGVVTKPFDFEGRRRMQVADRGITELRAEVDTLIIIPNQNLFRIASRETTFAEAFHMADQVLYSGVRGITDLMVMPGLINLDFADVRTVMAGMGSAMMGTGEATGEQRALRASHDAIANPLLDDVSLKGAKGVLINITGGYDMTLFEVDEAANEIRKEVDPDAHIILGSTFDEAMSGKIRVSVVAAGVAQTPGAGAPRAAAPAITPRTQGRAESVAAAASPRTELGLAAVAAPAASPLDAEPPRSAPIIRTRPAVVAEPEPDLDPAADADPDADLEIAAMPVASEAPPPRAPEPILVRAPEAPAAPPSARPAPEPEAPGKTFGGLFGWRRQTSEAPQVVQQPRPPENDRVEDELEIPAFLRRSAST
jgi:cell division protein FtsZ